MTKLILLSCGVVALGLMACSSDEDGGDGGSSGTDGGAGSPGTGGSGLAGGTGGTPGTGGGVTGGSGGGVTAGSGGMPGGTGGAPPAGDAGPSGGSGGGGTLPMDGSQNSFCQSTGDCNMGLACYEFGSYCSAECTMDTDCESLGANYTCFIMFGGGGGGTGVCRVECMDANDTSCPEGMSCVDIAMGLFRCAYPMEGGGGADGGMAGATPAFDECAASGDCAAGLECTAFMGGAGYCTQANCMDDADCTEQPSTGSVTATCSGFGLCTLGCGMDAGACPDGMECQTFGGGGFAFCNYP